MDIWAFAERFYGRGLVEAQCLRMQQENNVIVCLVIWFCWHTVHNRFIPLNLFDVAKTAIEQSQQQLILPLRQLRKHELLKVEPQLQQIVKAMLQAEILLEKNQLERLAEISVGRTGSAVAIDSVGLSDYLLACGVRDADQAACFLYANAESCLV